MSDSCTIDSFGPMPVLAPTTVAEVSDAVRQAAADRQALYPFGGRTMLEVGLPPSKPGRGVDLCRLDHVIDYPARDMTITVRAGITLDRLQQLLRTENQRLPIDVPRPGQATLGGIIATNTSGPRRLGFGTLRDYVIGISVVNDQGHEVKAGGRVVKNVAGYDLCKLHIGALGTLGIISQVTLKLKPLPEEQALISIGARPEHLETLFDKLHQSRTRPVCVELINAAAARSIGQQAAVQMPEAAWVITVGFEDNREAVTWQVKELIEELPAGASLGIDTRVGSTAEPLWRGLTEFPARPEAHVVFKANLLPQAVVPFCREAESLANGIALQAHAEDGVVLGQLDGELPLEQVQRLIDQLRRNAVAAQGNLVIHRCPAAWKSILQVWGSPRGDWPLMRTVKEKLDPGNLFNPGRFL